MAGRAGQTVAALAAEHRAGVEGRPPRVALSDPLRPVLPAHPLSALAEINQDLLERYLADLHAELAGTATTLGQLNSLLHGLRQHPPGHHLSATALIFPDDYPHRAERPPRALAEQVMAQIEHPDNLDRFTNPSYRLITVILE